MLWLLDDKSIVQLKVEMQTVWKVGIHVEDMEYLVDVLILINIKKNKTKKMLCSVGPVVFAKKYIYKKITKV